MARLSMRARVLCAAGAIVLMTAIPVAHPASAQGLNDIVRNLNNTMNPNDVQRREDQARREDQVRREDQARHREGRSEDGQYRRGDRPRPCAEAGCATGIAVISTMAPAAQSSLARIESLAIYWSSWNWWRAKSTRYSRSYLGEQEKKR